MIPARQSGYALLVVLVLTATASAVVAVPYLSRLAFDADPLAVKLRSANALKEAREALIAYAAIEDNTPGSLPCPDQNNDGQAQFPSSACNAPYIGRLPWKTLGLGKLTDGEGECLWYVLSPEFRNTIGTTQRGVDGAEPALNPSASGSIKDITTGDDDPPSLAPRVVAVIFAPHSALAGQSRGSASLHTCASGTSADFLESPNLSGLSVIQTKEVATYNDLILTLSSEKLFASVGKRVLGSIARGEPDGMRGLPILFNAERAQDPEFNASDFRDASDPALIPTSRPALIPTPRLLRVGSTKYSSLEFDDALQSMQPANGKVHYVHELKPSTKEGEPPVVVFDPQSGCYNYLQKYTTEKGKDGTPQSHHPAVPPAEWLCRNRWYDYIGYLYPDPDPDSAPNTARLWLNTVPPVSRTITFQMPN